MEGARDFVEEYKESVRVQPHAGKWGDGDPRLENSREMFVNDMMPEAEDQRRREAEKRDAEERERCSLLYAKLNDNGALAAIKVQLRNTLVRELNLPLEVVTQTSGGKGMHSDRDVSMMQRVAHGMIAEYLKVGVVQYILHAVCILPS